MAEHIKFQLQRKFIILYQITLYINFFCRMQNLYRTHREFSIRMKVYPLYLKVLWQGYSDVIFCQIPQLAFRQ